MNKEEKAKLWADRIQQYKTSGQTCKQWCAENGIPLSTMGYWTRRLAKEDPASEPEQDLVFARLPSEQEAARKLLSEETAPVRIFVSDSIRIEISDSCSAMLDLAGGTTVYLACGVTDLRKSYNGLAAIIKLKFHLDPYSRCMFAFCNRRRTSIKILQWDGSGFWILMKRLDRNAFHWPDTPDELRQVTLKEIHWLCDGLSLNPRGAFEEHHPKIIL
mgnify:CR=1 FL=1